MTEEPMLLEKPAFTKTHLGDLTLKDKVIPVRFSDIHEEVAVLMKLWRCEKPVTVLKWALLYAHDDIQGIGKMRIFEKASKLRRVRREGD